MKTLIIAEIGVNHNGSFETAIKLIDQAIFAGADAVKFQCFHAEDLVTQGAEKAHYQKQTTNPSETQLQMLKRLELDTNEFEKISQYCSSKQIKFLSTPFSVTAAKFLKNLNCDTVKISSGDITDRPLLEFIAKNKWDIIFSSGMATLDEIDAAHEILSQEGQTKNKISLLLCTSQYPTPFNDVHLNCLNTLRNRYNINIGLSDHTEDIHIPLAAVALGARIIEKHFTLDRNMPGPDHLSSIEPNNFSEMVKKIRDIESALGDSSKLVRKSEIQNLNKARKSIVASRKIKKGEIFSDSNLTTMRPGIGLSPMLINKLIGKRSLRSYNNQDFIELEELYRTNG